MLVTLFGMVTLIRLYMMYIYKHREKKSIPQFQDTLFLVRRVR